MSEENEFFLMFADEADQDASKEFIVHGAVFIPASKAVDIKSEVRRLKIDVGYPVETPVKSSPRSCPKNVSREDHASLKNAILTLAESTGCKATLYVVPSSIAKKQELATRLEWATNALCYNFEKFLKESKAHGGLVHFDSTTDFKQTQHLANIQTGGLSFPSGAYQLSSVVGLNTTSEHQSELSALSDIVVGSYRFVVNEPDKDKVGALLWKLLAPLLWGKKDAKDVLQVQDRGFVTYPRDIKVLKYEVDLEAFISRLKEYS